MSTVLSAAREPLQAGLISIVIPTYRRAASLREAVQTAVAQTYPLVEVLVTSDGPDAEARAAVEDMGPRVRYFELEQNAGPAAARNFGILHSRGEWITFLDDDDVMLPERLERQIGHVSAEEPWVMSACQLIYRRQVRAADGTVQDVDDVWPERAIAVGEDLGDFLLKRPSLRGRPGVVSLQGLIVHHSIARAVPMPTHPEHEDWAWLLDAWHLAGARVRFLMEPLVVYRIDTSAESRSRRRNWADSLRFATLYRRWLSGPAFCSFIASKVAVKARRAGDWGALLQVLRLLRRNGASSLDYAFFALVCAAPVGVAQAAWKLSLQRADARG